VRCAFSCFSGGVFFPLPTLFGGRELHYILITTTVTRNVTAPLAKTIATANEVIVGIGVGKETGHGRENERTVIATLPVTRKALTAATTKRTVIGTTTVTAITKKDDPPRGRTPTRLSARRRPTQATRRRSRRGKRGKPFRGARLGPGRKRNGGSPDRRSPTLVGIVALLQRKLMASGWDVHAPGFEQYSAVQARQTGLFNLPGLARIARGFRQFWPFPTFRRPMPVPAFAMGIAVNSNFIGGKRRSRRELFITHDGDACSGAL